MIPYDVAGLCSQLWTARLDVFSSPRLVHCCVVCPPCLSRFLATWGQSYKRNQHTVGKYKYNKTKPLHKLLFDIPRWPPSFNVDIGIHESVLGFDATVPWHLCSQSFDFEFGDRRGSLFAYPLQYGVICCRVPCGVRCHGMLQHALAWHETHTAI